MCDFKIEKNRKCRPMHFIWHIVSKFNIHIHKKKKNVLKVETALYNFIYHCWEFQEHFSCTVWTRLNYKNAVWKLKHWFQNFTWLRGRSSTRSGRDSGTRVASMTIACYLRIIVSHDHFTSRFFWIHTIFRGYEIEWFRVFFLIFDEQQC